jgi:hypothetical protein
VPLCIKCRDATPRGSEALRESIGVLDHGAHDSAAMMMRYAARLTIAQAPMRALAAMKPAGSA